MSKYKSITTDFDKFKKILLSNKETKKEYAALKKEFALISEMLRAQKSQDQSPVVDSR